MYPINPSPALVDPIVKVYPGALKAHEVERLIGYGDCSMAFGGHEALVGGALHLSRLDHNVRRTMVTWLQPGLSETAWIYQRAADVFRESNALFWNFDLSGIYDALQYLRYDGEVNGAYDWHIDKHETDRPQRKLSLSFILTDPAEFDGGEFQIHDGVEHTLKVGLGDAVVFPSFVLHRVLPVTRGIRRSLVAWAGGPRFR